MADQLGDSAIPVTVGQQGHAGEGNSAKEPKQAKTVERKQGKGKQAHKRAGKTGEQKPRLAEVGSKGNGFVKLVKENFGFISSPDLDEQLFFHASEMLPPEGHSGSSIPFAEAVAAGDEVEFLVGQNTGKRSNFVAKQVRKLPMHSVKAQLLSEERYLGTVTRELNSGQWRSAESISGEISFQAVRPDGTLGKEAVVEVQPADARHLRRHLHKGTLVEFNLCTENQTGQQRAVHIEVKAPPRPSQDGPGSGASPAVQPLILHGFVKSMKPQTGVIRCIEREERIQFKKSDVPPQHQDKLQVGAEVLFTVIDDARSSAPTVVSLAVLASGTLTAERSSSTLQGRVVRPINPPGKEKPEEGLIVVEGAPERDILRVPFTAVPLESSSEGATSLGVDDEVELQLVTDFKSDKTDVKSLRLLCKSNEKRELGQVRTLKGNFGFIRCCQRSGDLFFHYTTLHGCTKADLKKGDDVEFSVERNPEHGTIAVSRTIKGFWQRSERSDFVCSVRKMPPGSAVFETISEDEFTGVVHTAASHYSNGEAAYESVSGVVSLTEDGQPAKLLFGTRDFKDKVVVGDHVVFKIANNMNAAKAAEALGARVSRLVGRRATQGSLQQLNGTVRQVKGSHGFLRFTERDGVERSVFFHSSEVKDGAALKPGDEVSFNLQDNTRTKELNARRIQRTKEATETPKDGPEVKIATAERSSQGASKVTGNPVRMAAMPDGTRGFQMGRGKGLSPAELAHATRASVPVEIPGVPGKPPGVTASMNSPMGYSPGLTRGSQGKGSSTITQLTLESSSNGSPSPSHIARSSSGKALNPAAPTFMPKASSSSQLSLAADAGEPFTS